MLTAKRDKTEVVVALNPSDVESKLAIIHTGVCNSRFSPDSLGPLAYELTNLTDDASVTTVGATLDSLRSGFFAINIHKTGDPSTYTACGNIPVEADALTIGLGEQSQSGQAGWATLTACGDQTEVVLTVAGGVLESELVPIYSGSCGAETLGGVTRELTDFFYGLSTTRLDVSMASLRSGDFAINSHRPDEPAAT